MSKFKRKYRWREREIRFKIKEIHNEIMREFERQLMLGIEEIKDDDDKAVYYTTDGIYKFVDGRSKGHCMN